MADRKFWSLVDHLGRPIEKRTLVQEVAGPSVTGVRSPLSGTPGDGLDPRRLASILRDADQGEPLRYLELAEVIEERDLHYAGVLGTRRRAVSQLELTVEAASEDAGDVELADMVRDWLLRDELQDELFDMLDAIGKGVSFTEIMWDTSEGQWQPSRLEWRNPAWFKPDRRDLTTPMLIADNGQLTPLPGGKFICANIKAKSGLPLRSGLARVVAWAWMFKAFANRDWAIFIQNYGQPIRIGKYGSGASQKEKDTLFQAVANIAGDCAAIIPESMVIEFVTASAGSTTASSDLYLARANWLDQQVSKAVLGQTATTDAIAGGHAVGKEHRQVQEDIERADAKALAAVLNRDLIRPWVLLERGPGVAFPRLKIGRSEETDVELTVNSVARLVPLGLRVSQSTMRDIIGVPEPADGEELLGAPRSEPPPNTDEQDRPAPQEPPPALQSARAVPDPAAIAQEAAGLAAAAEAALLDAIAGIVAASASAEDRDAAIRARWPGLAANELKGLMARALALAELTGRADAGG